MLSEYRRREPAASSLGRPRLGRPRLPSRPGRRGALGAIESRLEALLMLARQLDEPWRHADVLVQRIATIVARDDRRTWLVGHRRGDLVEPGMQQIRDDLFHGEAGKELDQGVQTRGIVERQPYGVFRCRPQGRRGFFPAIEQGLEFHDYSAIPG